MTKKILNIEELNATIKNPTSNIDTLKGLEIIVEAVVYKVIDLFGKNSLLSMLYQVGAGPGEAISKRLKVKHDKEDFEIVEALKLLIKELKEYYSMQIISIEEDNEKLRLEVENHCFLRESFKHRAKLNYGTAFCRVNKGYFEVALKKLIGNKVKKIEINFLGTDKERDLCIEELIFYK